MVRDAKEYASSVVDGHFNDVLDTLGTWSVFVSRFMDNTTILDSNTQISKANQKMINVFLYYARCAGYNFSAIQR